MSLVGNQKVPNITLLQTDQREFNLEKDAPEHFTLLVFYRGLHCPKCKAQLKELAAKLDEFEQRGVHVVAISTDTKERAERAAKEWDLRQLDVAWGFPIGQARKWGLAVSEKLPSSEKKEVPEPEFFTEPGLFLIRPDNTVYAAWTQTTPFARPPVDELLSGIDDILRSGYPARGDVPLERQPNQPAIRAA